jgi:hypothetical protein
MISSIVPKILNSLEDKDEAVRFGGLDILLTLLEQGQSAGFLVLHTENPDLPDIYHGAIGALHASCISKVIKLLSDVHKRIKIGAVRLLPKVLQISNLSCCLWSCNPLTLSSVERSLASSTSDAVSPILCLLAEDSDICIAALEALSTLAAQGFCASPPLPRVPIAETCA